MIYQILIKSKRRFYIIILFSWVYKDWKLLVSFHFNSSSSLSIWLFFKIISKLQIYLIIFKKSENDSNMLSEISCFSVFFIFKNGKYFTVIKYVSLYFWTKISNTINKHALTSFYFGMKAKKLLTCFLWKEKKNAKNTYTSMLFINFNTKRMIIHSTVTAAATTTTTILPQIINATTIATTSTNSVTDMQRKNIDLRVRATLPTCSPPPPPWPSKLPLPTPNAIESLTIFSF